MGQAESQEGQNYDGLYSSVQHIDYNNIQSIDQMEKDLTMIKRLQQDPAFGDIKVLQKNKQESLYAAKSYVVTKENDFDKILKKAKVMSQIQSQYIVRIRGFYKQMQEDFCSKYIKSVLLFDYYKDNMQKKIIHRKQFEILFREVDIYFFVSCIVQGLKDLYSSGFIHGDIRPKTILFGNDGKYKLTEVNFMGTTTSYRNFLLGGKGSCYLSPELLEALKRRDINPDHDPFKSDIFSVGLICIEMATLSNMNNCYDFKNFNTDYEKITELLAQISKSHSEDLVALISGMVNINPDLRWDDNRIMQKLQPYQKDLQSINCSPVREQYQTQNSQGENIPNSLFNTQQQQFTTNENIDDVEEFKNQPNSVQDSRHNETEVKHPNQYDQKVQNHVECGNDRVEECDDDDDDIEPPCDEDEHHQSPEKHLPTNQSRQQLEEPSVTKNQKMQLEELIQSARDIPEPEQTQENPYQKRLETQNDEKRSLCPSERQQNNCPSEKQSNNCPSEKQSNNCPSEKQLNACPSEEKYNPNPSQQQLNGCLSEKQLANCPSEKACPSEKQSAPQSSCQIDNESIEERPKHAVHNNYRSNRMIPSKNLENSVNTQELKDEDVNNDRFLQSPQKLVQSDRLNPIYSNNPDEQELMQNLQQLDLLVNNTLSQNQQIKEKVSRLSLIPLTNTNNSKQYPPRYNSNGMETPEDRKRFSQYSPMLDDSQMFQKMNSNLSKIKDKLSPKKDQLPVHQQDSVYESIDSNALYDLYMQEYQKIKSQRKSQQQLY